MYQELQSSLGGGGGDNHFFTHHFTFTSSSPDEVVDTGYGSDLKWFVIYQQSSNFTSAPLGMAGWTAKRSGYYNTLTASGAQGASQALNTANNETPCKIVSVTNGVITIQKAWNTSYSNGYFVLVASDVAADEY